MKVVKQGRNRQGAIIRCSRKSCRQTLTRLNEAEYKKFASYQPNEIQCLNCKGYGKVSEIFGRFVDIVVCSDKCTGAVGPSCDCSCGGENHGGQA